MTAFQLIQADKFLAFVKNHNEGCDPNQTITLSIFLDGIINHMEWMFSADQRRYLLSKAPQVAPNIQ